MSLCSVSMVLEYLPWRAFVVSCLIIILYLVSSALYSHDIPTVSSRDLMPPFDYVYSHVSLWQSHIIIIIFLAWFPVLYKIFAMFPLCSYRVLWSLHCCACWMYRRQEDILIQAGTTVYNILYFYRVSVFLCSNVDTLEHSEVRVRC